MDRSRVPGEAARATRRGRALVIGYGNTLRGDDGIGPAAARAFECQGAAGGAEVIACHQLTPELAERLAAVDVAVFVDASADVPAGRVVTSDVEEGQPSWSAMAHHLDPATLLLMSRRLYGRSPKAYLVAVGAGSMTLGEGLSEPVAAALSRAVDAMRRLVSRCSQDG
jgi:hydrogenase maturation protease